MTRTAVLGVNAAHDAAACVLVDGHLAAAIAEERLSRIKYHEGFPQRAIRYCLDAAGLESMNEIDCLVINQYPKSDYDVNLRNQGYSGDLIVTPSHHLLHAYYAWVASGFSDAAVLILDGSGYSFGEYLRRGAPEMPGAPEFSEMEEAESFYTVVNGELSTLAKRWALWEASDPYYRFASLGHMYSMASQYIFGHWKHAGKTMGLAAYGDATAYPEPIIDISGEEMTIDTLWVTGLPPRSEKSPYHDPVCRNIAAKVQAELERAILFLVELLHRRTGQENLAVSGGVGLNSVTNGRILRESAFSGLFVTPAAGDAGVAIGAAIYGHSTLHGSVPCWSYRDDYHGRSYHRDEVTAALGDRRRLLRWEDPGEDTADRAAEDIASGLVIGWFESGSEFGPRSLGHRSILCDARDPGMRDYLNESVKFREVFRPYAASVLAEHAREYFDLDVEDPFMLIVAPVRAQHTAALPSVTHEDGTCRVQTLRPDHPGQFRRLVEGFFRRTGIPLVLNTSFNIRGEPIVETPAEAIACFLASNLDILYLEGHRVRKIRAAGDPAPGRLVPLLTPGLTLESRIGTRDGLALPAVHVVRTRTGHQAPLTDAEFALLSHTDGRRSTDEVSAAAGWPVWSGRTGLAALQERGLVAFAFPSDGPG